MSPLLNCVLFHFRITTILHFMSELKKNGTQTPYLAEWKLIKEKNNLVRSVLIGKLYTEFHHDSERNYLCNGQGTITHQKFVFSKKVIADIHLNTWGGFGPRFCCCHTESFDRLVVPSHEIALTRRPEHKKKTNIFEFQKHDTYQVAPEDEEQPVNLTLPALATV